MAHVLIVRPRIGVDPFLIRRTGQGGHGKVEADLAVAVCAGHERRQQVEEIARLSAVEHIARISEVFRFFLRRVELVFTDPFTSTNADMKRQFRDGQTMHDLGAEPCFLQCVGLDDAERKGAGIVVQIDIILTEIMQEGCLG